MTEPRPRPPVVTTRSPADVLAIARVLGHADVQVFQKHDASRWYCDCACGWVGVGMWVQREAVSKANHHLVSAVREMDRFAKSHGISAGEALGIMAVDSVDFENVVAERIAARESEW